MITDAVLKLARTNVQARFEMRDQELHKELDQVVAIAARESYGEDEGRVSVKVRLLCESDLNQRASTAWIALRKSHHDTDGVQFPGLQRELLTIMEGYMRDGALRLASQLRGRAEDLKQAFTGAGAIDAEWIAKRRRSAIEQQAQSIDDYVRQLPKESVVKGLIRR
ncbi:MAG: hypothetical protein AAGE01_02570 [Pseudomonadota bacterium]